ncbi:MAG: L-threonine dehydrogenase [Tepidibacter sp.]|uniref:L-threonine dehydrogenase n=1 Tax=Tepidibacter sp. TaxID=2529387 RepID=UPI0025D84F3F|nr:L-threonine dehydrogenase [Tepidibacter sp.]MCT4509141.1 L-threonine dehydrogenase [Tepidibacter sp.]
MNKTYKFNMPSVNLMGPGCLKEVGDEILSLGLKKALIVTDKMLVKIGLIDKLVAVLDENNIDYAIFDKTQPNPTVKNVEDGLALLKENNCDFIISFGGGSPHDCAKGIGIVANNGGCIKDYEGVNKSKKSMLPLVAINTTAGTASEMTKFCIITDEDRHIKMAIVDNHTTPTVSVNDPLLMVEKPASLTAATGMDALTHAIEAFVSTEATPVTDACALMAIELICTNLKEAVENGSNVVARDKMAYAQFLAGMAFNNASLGYVHAMAHQLGGFYDLPHGVCNAILLPHVQEYNSKVVPHRFVEIAKAMGENVDNISSEEAAIKVIDSIKKLSEEIGIPSGLKELDAKEEDLTVLSENALKDACGFTNPKQASLEEIIEVYKNAM